MRRTTYDIRRTVAELCPMPEIGFNNNKMMIELAVGVLCQPWNAHNFHKQPTVL
jgi:hypothetical protein